MAEQDDGGSGIGRKYGPLPAWGWALVIGGLVGVVYFVRQGNKAPAAAAATQAYGDSNDERTTVLPVDSGLANAQFQQLMDAIRALQGDTSATGPIGHPVQLPPDMPPRDIPGVTGAPRSITHGLTAIRRYP